MVCMLGMLKINWLTGLNGLLGKTGPETAGPVNRAVIQCLYITAPTHKFRYYRRHNFHFIILHAKANEHLPWHSALSRPTVRTRVGLSVNGWLSLHPWTSTYRASVMHVTWMSVLDRCQISLDCIV